ncbi:MAG: class II aldolase/adducin family protein [Pseudomonadales bacterium]
MTEQQSADDTEGTIRFAYSLEAPIGAVADADTVAALRGWREVLRRLGLLGQHPARYGGLGFGNMSARDPARPDQMIITASQSSGAETLEDDDLVRIVRSNPARFWVDAVGRQPPSSETLTHAMIYQADAAVRWVFHAHSPDIWRRATALGLPATPAAVAYGSTAMVEAVAQLIAAQEPGPLAFVTHGHEDGVFACGASAEEAGSALVALLARVLA